MHADVVTAGTPDRLLENTMNLPPKLRAWHVIVVVLVLVYVVDWFIQRPDEHSRALNDAIAANASETLRNYPYRFHVMRVEGDTAIMGTPRSLQVPVTRFIGAMFPDIDVMNNDDPGFIAAQKTLAEVQSEASRIVQSQPGIASVKWEIDRRWLGSHGIEVPSQ